MTVSASNFAQINPGVLGAGGNSLALNGLFLTNNPMVALGTVPSFPNATAVGNFFGLLSPEYQQSQIYFNGYINGTQIPSALLFSQYSDVPVSAWARSAPLGTMTLTQLQALSGAFDVTIDGTLKSAASVSFTGVTSFTAAAELLATNLGIEGVVVATGVTGAISGTTLSVTAITSGAISVGDVVGGTSVIAGTYISALGTGTGGIGTYTVSATQTVTSEALTVNAPGVSYNAQLNSFVVWSATTGTTSTMAFPSGTLAVSLGFPQAQGGVISQGAAAMTPATAMPAITAVTLNWGGFMTSFNASTADKIGFAQWNSAQNNRFGYVMWDDNVTALNTTDASVLPTIIADGYANVVPVYCDPVADPTALAAAMVLGTMASINFAQKNGRITFAFKYQAGVPASVTTDQQYANLKANQWNAVCAVATANQGFTFLAPGTVTGKYGFFDVLCNEIYLNSQFQLQIVTMMASVGSLPYNNEGINLQRSACMGPINSFINFGGIQKGVALDPLQAAAVNAAAGVAIDKVLTNHGFYLQILQPSAAVRAVRGSFITNLWYMDGGSVQQITMASIAII